MTKLIVFDYDGVIVDSLKYNIVIARECAALLGLESSTPSHEVRKMENMTFDALGQLLGFSGPEIKAFKDCVFDRFSTMGEMPSVFPGMISLFRQLHGDHILTIVTDNTETAVRRLLEKNGLLQYVSRVLGGNTGGPKSEKTVRLVNQFAIDRNAVYYVGDTIGDIREAKRARVKSIAVTWGFQDEEMLLPEAPEFIVHSPAELKTLFEGPQKKVNQKID